MRTRGGPSGAGPTVVTPAWLLHVVVLALAAGGQPLQLLDDVVDGGGLEHAAQLGDAGALCGNAQRVTRRERGAVRTAGAWGGALALPSQSSHPLPSSTPTVGDLGHRATVPEEMLSMAIFAWNVRPR